MIHPRSIIISRHTIVTTNVVIDARRPHRCQTGKVPETRPRDFGSGPSGTAPMACHTPGSSALCLFGGCGRLSIPHPTITRSNINSTLFGKFFKKEGEPAIVSTAFGSLVIPDRKSRSSARHGYQRTNPWQSRQPQTKAKAKFMGQPVTVSPSGQQSDNCLRALRHPSLSPRIYNKPSSGFAL
ncbi:hypothetical protein BC826DRAFT_1061839, partial [Russula brevipes]